MDNQSFSKIWIVVIVVLLIVGGGIVWKYGEIPEIVPGDVVPGEKLKEKPIGEGEMAMMPEYPEEYIIYQDYIATIRSEFTTLIPGIIATPVPIVSDTGTIEATVLSITKDNVCPYPEEKCRIEPYPKDIGVVRIDKIIDYTTYSEQTVEQPTEQQSGAEPLGEGKTTPGYKGKELPKQKSLGYEPLQAGQEIPTNFLLTTRPAKIRYVSIPPANGSQPGPYGPLESEIEQSSRGPVEEESVEHLVPPSEKILKWVDSKGRKPMSYKKFKQKLPPEEAITTWQIYTTEEATAPAPLVLVIVDSSIEFEIQDALAQYISDLENENYLVSVYSVSEGSPNDLRTYLQSKLSEGLVGCILIGDLPIPWYEINDYGQGHIEEFPMDLYYMDLDGTWNDTDEDGMLDEHLEGDGDMDPEIWIGRLTASTLTFDDANEADLLNNYFAKNHAYRTGSIHLNHRALTFFDDDWSHVDPIRGLDNIYDAEQITAVNDKELTNPYNYEDSLVDNYEFIQVFVHSSAFEHNFRWAGLPLGPVSNLDVKNIDPKALFYNLNACYNSRYTEENYMGGWYIFTDTYGLLAVGTTKAGGMHKPSYFYEYLSQGKNFGDAYKEWWISQSPYIDDWLNDYKQSWYYGLTLLGDPTLKIQQKDYQVPVLKYWKYQIDDKNTGNGNGTVEQSETVNLTVNIKNKGDVDATEVSCLLSTEDSYVDILDNSVYFGDISAGEERLSPEHFTFVISASKPRFQPIKFDLDITSKEGNFSQTFDVPVNIKIEQITTDSSAQTSADIYKDRLIYEDNRDGNSNIYMHNLVSGEKIQITNDPSAQCYSPTIYGDRIVWQNYIPMFGERNIYIYDISTREMKQITTGSFIKESPAIYGDKIVWHYWDFSGANDIYMYDLITEDIVCVTENSFCKTTSNPDIYGNKIIWKDKDIYMYDVAAGKETQITNNGSVSYISSPAIYKDKIVWSDERTHDYSIYMYNLTTEKESQIKANSSAFGTSPVISDDRIVWVDNRNNNHDLYLYNLLIGEEIQLIIHPSAQMHPAVYGDRIVWQDYRNGDCNIYMATVHFPSDEEPIEHPLEPQEELPKTYKPIPKEDGYFVFTTKIIEYPETSQKILPGIEIGSKFRAKIHYSGSLYIEEYEVIK